MCIAMHNQLEERMKKANAARDHAAALGASINVDSDVLLKYTRMIRVGVPLPKVCRCGLCLFHKWLLKK